jgi:integrase
MTNKQLKRSKARNNEGSIFKKTRKDGTVVFVVEISLGKKANGKRRRTQKTFKTLSAAKQGKVQMLKSQQEGRLVEVRNDTVYTYGLWWAREVKPQHIRETTAADYEDRLRRYVFPFLGSIRMVDLKTEHIVTWMNELKRSGKSANTINGARRVLTGLCKYAARTGVIPFNPVLATDSMRRQAGERSQVREPWTQDEMNQVLRAVVSNSKLDCFLHLMMHTGMRPGEVLGLRWQDIHESGSSLAVTGTLKQARRITPSGQGVVRMERNEPKTFASKRPITISPELSQALDRQKMYESLARITAGVDWVESDYVITTQFGTPVSLSNLRKIYIKFLSANKIRYIRLHDIRHSVATLSLGLGIPIEQVSQVLGHTRIETTKSIYAQHVPKFTENFALVLSASLPSAMESFGVMGDALLPKLETIETSGKEAK